MQALEDLLLKERSKPERQGSVNVDDCGSKATITNIEVEGCDCQPCTFIKGTTPHVKISFVPDRDYASASYKGTMIVVVPIALLEGDACENGPLTKGNPATLDLDLDFTNFPVINTRLTIVVYEGAEPSGQPFLCMALDVHIRNA